MEQRDNRLFEEIISGEFDDGLSKSIEMFDRSTNEFYQNFDKLTADIQETGLFDRNVSLEQVGIYFELTLNEIMHQDGDFDSKAADIIGITVADIIRRDEYIAKIIGIHGVDSEVKDDLTDVFNKIIYAMNAKGVDIARQFSRDYVKFIQTELEGVVVDLVVRYHQDKKDS